ncbi:MAG: hypothetical protein K9N47_28880 [Prosthecobacter sp.]|uniref:hypothetical protein n=1 Tax=Prosthecobacter sp. TaxID=1965333 RepID=UPI00260496FC|nr:hypothetical protein [Prosthecobacter sp.]MCF7790168.1 hypothetical protein [Prosthecobacter sp.]
MASQLHASFGERLGEGRCSASLHCCLVPLRTDWQFDDAMVQKIGMPWSIATLNKDGWGSLYYIVCDFNNDGKAPNPELLTAPPKARRDAEGTLHTHRHLLRRT